MKAGEDRRVFDPAYEVTAVHTHVANVYFSVCTGMLDGYWQIIVRSNAQSQGRGGELGEPIFQQRFRSKRTAMTRHEIIVQTLILAGTQLIVKDNGGRLPLVG